MLSTLRFGAYLRRNRLMGISSIYNSSSKSAYKPANKSDNKFGSGISSSIAVCSYCNGDTCLKCGLSGYILDKDLKTDLKDRS